MPLPPSPRTHTLTRRSLRYTPYTPYHLLPMSAATVHNVTPQGFTSSGIFPYQSCAASPPPLPELYSHPPTTGVLPVP